MELFHNCSYVEFVAIESLLLLVRALQQPCGSGPSASDSQAIPVRTQVIAGVSDLVILTFGAK